MTLITPLRLEVRDEPLEDTSVVAPGIMMTPALGEDYWLWRVRLTEKQAIVGFPKFTMIGIGFVEEEDWNTNLPSSCTAEEIWNHIAHNAGDPEITKEAGIAAIQLIKDAAAKSRKGTR